MSAHFWIRSMSEAPQTVHVVFKARPPGQVACAGRTTTCPASRTSATQGYDGSSTNAGTDRCAAPSSCSEPASSLVTAEKPCAPLSPSAGGNAATGLCAQASDVSRTVTTRLADDS
jgi:hypothetical protein